MDVTSTQEVVLWIAGYLVIAVVCYIVASIIRIRTATDEDDVREVFGIVPLIALGWPIAGIVSIPLIVFYALGELREWAVKRIMKAKGR